MGQELFQVGRTSKCSVLELNSHPSASSQAKWERDGYILSPYRWQLAVPEFQELPAKWSGSSHSESVCWREFFFLELKLKLKLQQMSSRFFRINFFVHFRNVCFSLQFPRNHCISSVFHIEVLRIFPKNWQWDSYFIHPKKNVCLELLGGINVWEHVINYHVGLKTVDQSLTSAFIPYFIT